jgi:hypothetical protein
MVTAIWSNDPEFYKIILGDDDLLEHIFIKINYTDTSQIINRFNLHSISENIFIRSDDYKYICVTAENTKNAMDNMKETMKTV